MAQLASDNFNRANENPLAAPWVIPQVGQGIQLVSNQTQGANASQDNVAIYDGGIAWPDDQYSQATMVGPFDGANTQGLVIRWNNTSNGYALVLGPTSGDAVVYIVTNGGYVALSLPSVALVANDVMTFEARGDLLTVRQNGQILTSLTDTGWRHGSPGLHTFNNAAGLAWDNWSGGDYARTPGVVIHETARPQKSYSVGKAHVR